MGDVTALLLQRHSELYDTRQLTTLIRRSMREDSRYCIRAAIPVTHLFALGVDVVDEETGECIHVLARRRLQMRDEQIHTVDVPSLESALPATLQDFDEPSSPEARMQQATHLQRAVIQEWRTHAQAVHQQLLKLTPLPAAVITHIIATQLALDLSTGNPVTKAAAAPVEDSGTTPTSSSSDV